MSEFRYCKLKRDWTLFSPKRAKRPSSFGKNILFNQKRDDCPFEEGNEHLTISEISRISDHHDINKWRCRVVPNLYNALSIERTPTSKRDSFFETRDGFGAHEVIIETPHHNLQMYDFEIDNFIDYFTIIKERLEGLKRDTRVKYISIFKNHGKNAGATLSHSHSQLIAMPFIPKKEMKNIKFYKKYYQKHKRNLFNDIIYEEKEHKKGILFENSSFIAFCPYASSFAFEVMIISKNSHSCINQLNDKEIYALSEVMTFVFHRLKKALEDFPFNMIIKNAPFLDDSKIDNSYRFHIHIIPRLYNIAGYELDSDIFINTILPETAAKVLKES